MFSRWLSIVFTLKFNDAAICRVPSPEPSNWKIEDGKWCWYVDPANIGRSPFGKMTPGPDAPLVNGAPISLSNVPSTADFLFTQVKVDKQDLTLKPGESATVTVTNGAPGIVTLTIPTPLIGIAASLDKTSLQSGEKAILTVKAGDDLKPGVLNLQVEPTTQILPIKIAVKN